MAVSIFIDTAIFIFNIEQIIFKKTITRKITSPLKVIVNTSF